MKLTCEVSTSQVYQGGIGSYALLVMVASFLLQHRSRTGPYGSANTLEPSLGILLLDFFHLFGRTLNYEDVALSCRCFPHQERANQYTHEGLLGADFCLVKYAGQWCPLPLVI